MPIERFSTWKLSNVQSVYTYMSGLHLKDAIRSWLGPKWAQAVGLMELLAQEDGNRILGPDDHATHTGTRNPGFDAREAPN